MLGSASDNGSGYKMHFSLNNNSNTGMYLAVYGILAWRMYYNKLWAAWPSPGGLGLAGPGNYAYTAPVLTNAAVIAGTIGIAGNGGWGTAVAGVHFLGDGANWLTMGDTPLFIVPPGSCLIAGPEAINLQPLNSEPTACTFLWGPYARSRRQQA